MAYNKTVWENAPSTNSPINANNLNKIEEGIYQNSLKADQVGDLTNLKTTVQNLLVSSINEIYDDIYYKDNDTFEVHEAGVDALNRLYTSGLITGVNLYEMFCVYTPKSLKNINSVTINELKLNVRNSNGAYVEANTYTQGGKNFNSSDYTPEAIVTSENCITIRIAKSNGGTFSNTTNNTPQTIEINNMTLTLSE